MSDVLLPHNATPQELALEGATARLSDVPVAVADVWNPDTCPEALLPWLAWAFSADEWSSAWEVTQKRQAVKQSVEVHRHKGTVGAVKTAMTALGIEVQLQEWFAQTPAGDPYTFRLIIDAQQYPVDQAALTKLLAVVYGSKNLRSHISEIAPGATSNGTLYLASGTCLGNEITVEFDG